MITEEVDITTQLYIASDLLIDSAKQINHLRRQIAKISRESEEEINALRETIAELRDRITRLHTGDKNV